MVEVPELHEDGRIYPVISGCIEQDRRPLWPEVRRVARRMAEESAPHDGVWAAWAGRRRLIRMAWFAAMGSRR